MPELRVGGPHRTRSVGLVVGLCLAALCGASSATPASAAEAGRPQIESTSSGAGAEVTVGAQIDPEGLPTEYVIEVECGASCGTFSQPPRSEGVLPGDFAAHEVSLDVTGLPPGTYWFSVLASNADGGAFRRSDILTVPPASPCPDGCPVTTEPYKPPEISPEVFKQAEEEAWQIAAEAEARRRQAATLEQEAKAREAAILAAEATATTARQPQSAPTSAPSPACVAPALRGDTLSAARRVLAKAHCKLGKVSHPSHRSSQSLVVSEQSAKRGRRLADDAAISVVLAPKHHRYA
jgi:hypothetical protein